MQEIFSDSGIEDQNRDDFVPWQGSDVFFIFVVSCLLILFCTSFCVQLFVSKNIDRTNRSDILAIEQGTDTKTARLSPDDKKTTLHPLTQLIQRGREKPIILLVAFLSGVVLAPLTEEFLFRLVLQGWLTKTLSRFGNQRLRNTTSCVLSLLIVSLLFAFMHGGERREQAVEPLFAGLLGLAIANLLIFVFGTTYLSLFRQARAKDLGFDFRKIPKDLALGGLVFFIATPFILGLNYFLRILFPDSVVDPIPLFFLALILGTLFYKTRRIQSSIILHALFNGFSFLVLAFAPFK